MSSVGGAEDEQDLPVADRYARRADATAAPTGHIFKVPWPLSGRRRKAAPAARWRPQGRGCCSDPAAKPMGAGRPEEVNQLRIGSGPQVQGLFV